MTSENPCWPGIFRLTAELAAGELERWENCPVPQGVCRNAWYLEGGILIDPWDDPEWGVSVLEEENPGPVKVVLLLSNPQSQEVLTWLKSQNPDLLVVDYVSGRAPLSWGTWQFEFWDDPQRPGSGMVLEKTSGVLFSGEMFSCPGETEGLRDSVSLTPSEKDFFQQQALLWYASRGPFPLSKRVLALPELKAFAPRLGLAWGREQNISEWYEDFADWSLRGPSAVTLLGAPEAGLAEPWYSALTAGLSSAGLAVQLLDTAVDPLETVAAALLSSCAVVVIALDHEDELWRACQRLGLKRSIFTLVPLSEKWSQLGVVSRGPDLAEWLSESQKASETGRLWGLSLLP